MMASRDLMAGRFSVDARFSPAFSVEASGFPFASFVAGDLPADQSLGSSSLA